MLKKNVNGGKSESPNTVLLDKLFPEDQMLKSSDEVMPQAETPKEGTTLTFAHCGSIDEN